ncbi:hypothetical protein [Desulforamulus hydrothermalis]|uniref:Uncharacterized protein n=1 Tax=Desulforamulus hydrothermalis Lam5 = DSM 18033 TaxID=1121428 RepID=K8EHW8_9FIRM|nr:hypothetical protein [Desulforamulus hydrothermalis]CCO08226.1 conserved hypothetical protein [Desulforamulus hydrothermalis Lam5 = DSM 18033]SHH22036.1 hypothetical protein SAMN02745177_01855 [Desulforamulus hydrothermalis Lam5 = DSM 18033]
MKSSVFVIIKPRQLVRLLVVLACFIAIVNVIWENIKQPGINLQPHNEPPEIERGEYLSWDEVDQIFRRYTNATVVDVDTGLSFRVQRRGGTYHADVQPLTAKDTAVMKVIYDGKWSWKRKAVVVEVGGRRIAASMNGMPHGSGAIRGNNFNGHFCIHFRDSKVHQSGQENLAHQMMVWKAAGRFKQIISAMGPQEVIEVFITALDQEDVALALKTLHHPTEQQRACLTEIVSQVAGLKVQRIRSEGGSPEIFRVYLVIRYLESPRDVEKKIELQVVDEGERGYRIIADGMGEILNRKATVELPDTKLWEEADHCE